MVLIIVCIAVIKAVWCKDPCCCSSRCWGTWDFHGQIPSAWSSLCMNARPSSTPAATHILQFQSKYDQLIHSTPDKNSLQHQLMHSSHHRPLIVSLLPVDHYLVKWLSTQVFQSSCLYRISSRVTQWLFLWNLKRTRTWIWDCGCKVL